MVVLMLRFGGYFDGRSDAAVKRFAADVLELNGCMADLKVIAEQGIEIGENADAFGGRDVVDGDVAG